MHELEEEEEEEEIDRDGRTVEELVSFITGDDKQGDRRQAKVDKKARQKQKKVRVTMYPCTVVVTSAV